MPFLTIAGIEVDIVEFAEAPSETLSPKTRSWNGTLRGTPRGVVRSWTGTANEMTRAAYAALRDATKDETIVAVAGDAIPLIGTATSRSCVVRLGGAEYVRNGAGYLLVAPLEIESVNPE